MIIYKFKIMVFSGEEVVVISKVNTGAFLDSGNVPLTYNMTVHNQLLNCTIPLVYFCHCMFIL